MSSEDKLLYMVQQCCENIEDLMEILHWIENENIDTVYHNLHFMFDEDDYLLPH